MGLQQKRANVLLRRQRQQRGWSLKRVAEELCRLCEHEERLPGVNENIIGKWERGEKRPGPYYRELFCKLYKLSAEELGFIESIDNEEHLKNDLQAHVISSMSLFDVGILDKLDSAESIINLAWEAWFASRPREAAR